MDFTLAGSIVGAVSFGIHTIQGVIHVLNHKRCRSNCMGKEIDMSLDIDNTSPMLRGKKSPDSLDGSVKRNEATSLRIGAGKQESPRDSK